MRYEVLPSLCHLFTRAYIKVVDKCKIHPLVCVRPCGLRIGCFGGRMKSTWSGKRLLLQRIFPGLLLPLIFCATAPAAPRPVAPWPPPPGPLRLIIDTDTGNEVDDQYALALALGE